MQTFNITDYGAKICDRLQTSAIQKAIDDCFLAGGGRVVIPCGIFLTGGIRIRSGVQLYLESGAILKGSRDPEDYMGYLEDFSGFTSVLKIVGVDLISDLLIAVVAYFVMILLLSYFDRKDMERLAEH